MTTRDFLRHRLVHVAAAVIVLAGALALLWRHTALADVVTVDNVVDWIERFSSQWWAPLLLVLAYTPASAVMFPRPLLTMAAVVAFGPWKGFAIAMIGSVVNALAGYAMGRLLDERRIQRWAGPRLGKVKKLLRKQGFMAVAAVGLLPVAPFLLETIVFGALRVRLVDLALGVTAAMLPGTLATTVLSHQLAAVLSHERSLNPWIVVGVVAAMALLGWGTHRWWRRVQVELA